MGHGLLAPKGQLGNRDTSFSVLGVFVRKHSPSPPPYCFPFLGINLGTVLISQPCLFFLALLPLLSGDCPWTFGDISHVRVQSAL